MTSYTTANTINDLFRSLFALLDEVAYWLLGSMYEILFNVASTDIFDFNTIATFYSRIQLIIGVFMIFKLAVSIIQGIINPDTFMDKKAGASSLIGRIVFALILLTVLTPMQNIPATNKYQERIKNNGILFGTLYSLQDRLLYNNTLGRLILGSDSEYLVTEDPNDKDDKDIYDLQNEKIISTANRFAVTILKGFIHINVADETKGENVSSNRACNFSDGDLKKVKTEIYDPAAAEGKSSPKELLSIINLDCKSSHEDFEDKSKVYAFTYVPIISTIVAGLFVYILLGEIITIAIRSLKLAVLRLLAPIPIISYIDPKSAKDGAFGSWVKALTSTYLELFIHLAVIYFVIFLIQDIIKNGINNKFGPGAAGFFAGIFIFVGLFFFIKQAPKFIKDMLGIKGTSANIGLAGLLGGTAMALEGKHRSFGERMQRFGMGAVLGTDSATQGYNQGKAVPLGAVWTSNQNQMAKMLTGDKDAQGGMKGHWLDKQNFKIRESQARRLGMGVNDVADAKYIKDVREAEAGAAKRELDFATQALNSLGPNATPDERQNALQRYEDAYKKYEAYQAAYGKADSAHKKMDSDRANFGVGPRISDKRGTHATYRSPHETLGTAETDVDRLYGNLPDTPQTQAQILDTVTEHRNDLKNFTGTADDSGVGSSRHGAGGGPGHP